MKGITPVIAVILLLLVTVAIVGFAFGFFQRIFGLAGTGVENQTTAVIQRTAQTVAIDNMVTQSVTVRNTGTADIKATTGADSEVNVFVGGTKITCSWTANPISPRTTSTCTWIGTPCNAGSVMKVVAPGNEDSRTC